MSALSVINNFFLGHDMLVNWIGNRRLRNKKREVTKDQHAMKSARSLGTQVTELIKRTKS